MPTQVQFRRGNTSQHSTFTGAEGEITVNTEKDILVVHDGSTVSGHEVARVNNPYFNGTVNVANVNFSNSLHPNSNGTHSIGNGAFRWEKLWLSNSGISIGTNAHTITSNSTTFIFSQNVTTNDSFIIVQGATVGPVVNTSGFYGNVTANALNVGGDVTITGNLIVTGTTLTVNTTTLDVKDLNITVAKGALNASAANGAGITIDGVNATILYTSATNTFNFSNYINVGNSTVNTTVNATSFTGDSATVGGNTASNLNTYADNKAANAYSNAVSYADGRIIDSVTNTSIAYAASANSVKNAYDRAIDANTRANSAQTAATSAYSNAVAYANSLIIDSVTNTSITYAASANSVKNAYDRAIDANTRAASAQTEASSAYTNAASYADAKAANAYSNAVAYANSLIIDSVTNTSITHAASANSVKNAYDRAIDANTRAYSAQTEASNAYSNATSYADNKAANAYSNAVAYANSLIIDSVTNTSITYVAAANSVKNAYDRAIDANTRAASAQTEASAAYSNATIFASNASNVNTGTLAEVRLPFRMNQNVQTTDNVTFANIALTGGTITTDPQYGNDIVNKTYVDAIASGFNYHTAVRLSTVITFDSSSATYDNGANGIGATITDNSPYSAYSVDGVTAALNDRILLRTSSNTALNGIYVVSNTGSVSYPWIITRASDYNHAGTTINEIAPGDFIYVRSGSTLAGTSWIQQQTVTNIGTDSITFAQFSSKGLYSLSSGIGLYYDIGGAYDGSAASSLSVNSSYIGTLTSNNSTFAFGKSEGNLSVNSAVYANQSITNTFTVGTASYFVANGNFGIANATPDATLTVTGTANISGQTTFGNTVILGNIERNNISNTTATVSQTAIDSFSATAYRSAKYIIQATNSTNYHYTEVAVVHDGTAAYATEFATMFTGSSLVSFAVDISGGNVRLLATAANATTTTYKIDRKLIKV